MRRLLVTALAGALLGGLAVYAVVTLASSKAPKQVAPISIDPAADDRTPRPRPAPRSRSREGSARPARSGPPGAPAAPSPPPVPSPPPNRTGDDDGADDDGGDDRGGDGGGGDDDGDD